MKRIIPLIIVIVAISGGLWWLNRPDSIYPELTTAIEGPIGSGSIEAETIAITAELGGRVVELKVDEGDEVKAGQVLVELDKSDLLAQKIQLEAALTTAKTNLDLISAPARSEDVAVARAKVKQAEVAANGAKHAWQSIEDLVNNPHELEAEINRARTQVTEAERNLELAQVNLKRSDIQTEAASRSQVTMLGGNEGLVQHDVAQYQLQAAQARLEMAEIALAGARRQVEHLSNIRDRPLQLIVRANTSEAAYHQAEAAVLVAAANLAAVKADPTAEDVAVAHAKVQETEAALTALEAQLAKQTLTAPRQSLVAQKLISPGELAAPGAVLLELSNIETVDLTVYIPETQIGQVKIGQQAHVSVDAYDNERFEGTVSFIAHEAEFTPRNVQTQEERVNLVFAVKISLDNDDQRLKPGMPADAQILAMSQPGYRSSRPSPQPTPNRSVRPTAGASPTSTSVPTRAETTPTVAPSPTEADPATYAEVLTWGLNVRSGPGVDYPVVGWLPQGASALVLDVDPETGWLQVRVPESDKIGWISANPAYVSLDLIH
jgi:multidrug resistance efflux pump